jgi:glutamate dehydrogenase
MWNSLQTELRSFVRSPFFPGHIGLLIPFSITALYLNPLPGANAPPIEHSIFQVTKEASLLYCLPDNPFVKNPEGSSAPTHAVQEATYAYAGWIFAQHFCNRLGPAYLALKNVLDESNPGHAEVLSQIKKRFREETFTRQRISEAILAYPELVSHISFSRV